MNTNVNRNYSKLKPALLVLPVLLLIIIVVILYSQGALDKYNYVQVQKEPFFFINLHLGQFPNIEYNLTQLGDEMIFLSFLSIFFVDVPELWQALIPASIVSALFSCVLKTLFAVPRPATVFDNNSFIIVGKPLDGFTSLPSGHAITIFTTLSILMFACMPGKLISKIVFVSSTLVIGLVIAFSRVAVGAHYPLDVVIGSILGYISCLIGIFISRKINMLSWISNKKYYPIFLVLILGACISIISRIINENLFIYYLALMSLIVAFYKIMYEFSKK